MFSRTAKVISAAALLIAIANMPSGYYTFLRILVFLVSILCIVEYWKSLKVFSIPFFITGILFNPIIPVYLYKRSVWMPIDIIAAILFVVAVFVESEKKE